MRKYLFLIMTSVLALTSVTSCGEYQEILKSEDKMLKLNKAKEYYEAGDYNRAYTLLDDCMTLHRGTSTAQEVYMYYCKTMYAQHNYILAGYHFKRFSQTYTKHEFAEEAAYMAAYCYYLEAPGSSLDPAYLYKAMDELQLFINTHPGSTYIPQCTELMEELRERLEEKSYNIAYGYYHRGEYASAVVSFTTVMSEYPDTDYREQAMYYRADAAFKLASNSIKEKETLRFQEALTACLEFKDEFPESEFLKPIDKLIEQIKEKLEKEQ